LSKTSEEYEAHLAASKDDLDLTEQEVEQLEKELEMTRIQTESL